MASLTITDLRKSLSGHEILKGIDLIAEDGQLVVLVGPSGCGKSTLLRAIAGLSDVDGGSIKIGDRDVTDAPPKARDVAMVFQNYALYPHMSVRDNVAFGLKLRKERADLIQARIDEVSAMLGLGELLDRLPKQLSGGQRQRVAMGRAIARRPQLFLFDEPLSNLDAALRNEVRVEIRRLHQTLRTTMVYVTHDQVEAMTLADQLVVLNAGRVEQSGPPLEVYHRPASKFVASFMGSPAMNFCDATVQNGRAYLGAAVPNEPHPNGPSLAVAIEHNGPVALGLRAQDVVVDPDGPLALEIEVIEAMGFETFAHGRLKLGTDSDTGSNTDSPSFIARLESEHSASVGETLRLRPREDGLHVFDPDTGRRLEP